MSQEEKDQERETMDKKHLMLCILNLIKVVHHLPRSGRVLANIQYIVLTLH